MTVRASKTGEWRWSHRFNADLNFKYKTGNWQFSARDREWDITDMGEIWAGIETESVPALGVRVKYMF